MIGIMFLILSYFVRKYRKIMRKQVFESVDVLKKMNNMKKVQTFEQNRKGKSETYPVSDCAICLEDYEAEDKVIQLSCHESHVFHFECL
jgi:hypothetical protein